ncbi:MAG TPA: hypothetical protein VEF76_06190 [Patescibacteria group bacterium]|nr:hypothetical protein [Patescibacteria group bacterium]
MSDEYIVRVVYKSENVEVHEFKNKQKALAARDRFRKMDTVASAKLLGEADFSDNDLSEFK